MPRQTATLYKTDLDKLRVQAGKDPAFTSTRADGGESGLYVQARRGRVTFFFRYQSPTTQRRRRIDLGEYGDMTLETARGEAGTYRKLVAAGLDPLDQRAEEERQEMTLAQGVELYLADLHERAQGGTALRGKRSGYASAKRRLERNVVPRLGGRRIVELSSDDVRRLHRAMRRTPAEANRTLTALSAVYGYLDLRELVAPGMNPCRHVEKHRENGRRRAITPDELQRLGEVMVRAEKKGTAPAALLAIRLLALTGMRYSEVVGAVEKNRRGRREGLRWGDVDLDRGLVHLADTKTGRQTRVIGAAAVELLQDAKPSKVEPSWCVCPGTMEPTKPFVGVPKIRHRLWAAAGIEATPEGRADLHSLRHSFASTGAHLQGGKWVGMVSALLGHGHQGRSVTERYITSNPEALRPAADAIAGELARLLGLGEPGRVLSFRGGG